MDCGSVRDIRIDFVRLITGDAMAFIDPLAEINQFAAFAAERTPALQARPLHRFTTGWACDGFRRGRGTGHSDGL